MDKRMTMAMATVFAAIIVSAGFIIYERRVSLRCEAQSVYKEAKIKFEEGNYANGASLLESKRNKLIKWFTSKTVWNDLELECAESDGNKLKVISMYSKMPRLIINREQCSLWVCRYFLSRRRLKEFDYLRRFWESKEIKKHLWFNLDYDLLVAREQFDEARDFLFSKEFEGKKDCGRLVRCAILSSQTDLRDALGFLAKAWKLNPKDPDVHLFLGQILEAVKDNRNAESHYLAAFYASRKSDFYRSRLGDYYVRRNQVLKAIRIWDSGKEKIRPDYLSRKLHFWNKVSFCPS